MLIRRRVQGSRGKKTRVMGATTRFGAASITTVHTKHGVGVGTPRGPTPPLPRAPTSVPSTAKKKQGWVQGGAGESTIFLGTLPRGEKGAIEMGPNENWF